MAGSFACTRLTRRLGSKGLMTLGFSGILIGGLVIFIRCIPDPWGLALPMTLVSFSFGLSRPPSNNLVLEQVDQYAGAASSLLIFIYFMLGAAAMWLISLNWADKIRTIGLLGIVSGGLMLAIWLILLQTSAGKRVALYPAGEKRA